LNFRPQEYEFFYIISVPYTISDLHVPKTLQYMPRGAKWRDVNNLLYSFSKCEKSKSA